MNDKKIVLNPGQKDALKRIEAFLKDPYSRVFILKGFAGTGKTTITKVIVEHMERHGLAYSLLASTGRAAKVLADKTGRQAKTIHSEIYGFGGFNDEIEKVKDTEDLSYVEGVQLRLNFSLKQHDTNEIVDVYIIDESSMISDTEDPAAVQSKFGNGKLLTDLFSYDRSAKFIFVGDPCQLPPVDGGQSPALSPSYIHSTFDIDAKDVTLTEVMRQAEGNGIVAAATRVRQLWENAPETETPYGRINHWCKLPFRGTDNLILVPDTDDLARRYIHDIKDKDYTKAAFICSSNTKCFSFSQIFREAIGFSGPILPGELLLVVQNNTISRLRNGDLVTVEKVSSSYEKVAGLTFREIEVREIYYGNKFKQLMIEDLLYQPRSNLDAKQQNRLFYDFILRMRKQGIKGKKDPRFMEQMKTDPYLNALRVSFGYAMTCHKAQGGEWENVYALFPRNIMLNPTKQKYQWVYTAMTRAREKFFVVDDIYIEGYRKPWI